MHRLLAPILVLSTLACAPLVSQRRRTEKPAARVAQVAPPKAPAPAPVVVARAEPVAPPPPAPPPVAPPAVEPAPAKASAERTTFYAFSDVEVAKLKKHNRTFAKLVTQHRTCTTKSERMIAKREQLRDQIIELQNRETRTAAEERRLTSLRAEERRMKQDRRALATCEPLERKLTEMLQAEYGTTASLDDVY